MHTTGIKQQNTHYLGTYFAIYFSYFLPTQIQKKNIGVCTYVKTTSDGHRLYVKLDFEINTGERIISSFFAKHLCFLNAVVP